MYRRALATVTLVVVSAILTACADISGPTTQVCPVSGGSQTCDDGG